MDYVALKPQTVPHGRNFSMGDPGTITAIRVTDMQQQPSHKLLRGSGLVCGITFY